MKPEPWLSPAHLPVRTLRSPARCRPAAARQGGASRRQSPAADHRYDGLAEEASSAGDQVATPNHRQHADHFIRLVNAQRAQLRADKTGHEEAARVEPVNVDLIAVD